MSEAEARAAALRHAVGTFFPHEPPDRIGVAVSGGGDSLALLDLVLSLGRARGFEVRAVTVDHGLRAEAADEAEMVAQFCAERGVAHDVPSWTGWDGQGNLQAAAREARYRLIAGWARDHQIDQVALGHTRDDVAETFLQRLARASGVDGLATMAFRFTRNGITWLRPLLSRDRAELRHYLTDQGIAWAEDPSNEDDRFDRIKARRIMAALEPLGISAETLATVSHHMSSAKSALEHYTRQEVARLVAHDRGDVIVTLQALSPVPEEIERRLLVAAIRHVSGGDYPPRQMSLVHMEAALADSDTHTVNGCIVTLAKPKGAKTQTLRIAREFNAVKQLSCASDEIWDGRWCLDGPHAPDLTIRALGAEGLIECTDWRDTGMPRASLLASPAVWQGDRLVAAPIAGYAQGWTARIVAEFATGIVAH